MCDKRHVIYVPLYQVPILYHLHQCYITNSIFCIGQPISGILVDTDISAFLTYSHAKILNEHRNLWLEKSAALRKKTIYIWKIWNKSNIGIRSKRRWIDMLSGVRVCLFVDLCSARSFNGVKYLENNKTPYFTETPIAEAAMQISRGTSPLLVIVRARRSATDVFNYSIKTWTSV